MLQDQYVLISHLLKFDSIFVRKDKFNKHEKQNPE